MDKLLFSLVIIGLLVWYLMARQPSPSTAPGGSAAPASTTVAPAATPTFSTVRAEIESVCKKRNVELVNYTASANNIVEIVVRGTDRNSITQILDDIGPSGGFGPHGSGLMKDLMHDEVKYSTRIENGRQYHYAYYKMRAYR